MTVWIYAPVGPAGLDPTALELITLARRLDEAPVAVALGPGARGAADALGAHGAARVLVGDDPLFADSPGRPAAHVLAGLNEARGPSLVLFPGTSEGRDVCVVAGVRSDRGTGRTQLGRAIVDAIGRAIDEGERGA